MGFRTNWVTWSLITKGNSGGSKVSRHTYASRDSAPSQTLVGQKLDPRVSFCENTMRALSFSRLFKNLNKIENKNSFGVCTYVYCIQFDQTARNDPVSQDWPKFDLWWFLWPNLIWNNFEFQSLTKLWVETYVYLIYFDQLARFDPYWTGMTQVWPLMTLINLEKYEIWIFEKILSRNIRILDTYNKVAL